MRRHGPRFAALPDDDSASAAALASASASFLACARAYASSFAASLDPSVLTPCAPLIFPAPPFWFASALRPFPVRSFFGTQRSGSGPAGLREASFPAATSLATCLAARFSWARFLTPTGAAAAAAAPAAAPSPLPPPSADSAAVCSAAKAAAATSASFLACFLSTTMSRRTFDDAVLGSGASSSTRGSNTPSSSSPSSSSSACPPDSASGGGSAPFASRSSALSGSHHEYARTSCAMLASRSSADVANPPVSPDKEASSFSSSKAASACSPRATFRCATAMTRRHRDDDDDPFSFFKSRDRRAESKVLSAPSWSFRKRSFMSATVAATAGGCPPPSPFNSGDLQPSSKPHAPLTSPRSSSSWHPNNSASAAARGDPPLRASSASTSHSLRTSATSSLEASRREL
mmetsp:Transcript_49343/g.99344  ORF Transcript_49343/g.99344 Transcript_49343/m.99344 type:complete len:404 (-) Transcript_49343:30-1241(-)